MFSESFSVRVSSRRRASGQKERGGRALEGVASSPLSADEKFGIGTSWLSLESRRRNFFVIVTC